MAIELVTGYQGRDHVTADQWADFNRGIFGDAAILPVGNKMEVAIQTANKITVKDGIAVIDGRQVSIGYGESENITIKSGTQGKLRRDIVVLEYKRVEDTGVESVQFKVIDGTPATSNAQDPAVRNTDIRTGAIVSQKPFCRVRLNGTAIEGVDSLIRVKELKDMAFYEPVNNLVGTDPKMALAAPMGKELKKSIDQINTDLTNKTIQETGSNEKGHYIKFADGTMICYYIYSSSSRKFDGSDVFGIRYCTDTLWFPEKFNMTPTVSANVFIDGYCGFVGRIKSNSISVSLMLCTIGDNLVTRDIEVNYIAIGRWK